MNTPAPTPGPSARDHLALALDVGGLDAAEPLAGKLSAWFSTVKVGLELYAEAGPEAFARFRDLGFRVFADLKLHDIPNTVERAARVLGRHGVDFLNFHAAGGEDMLRAGVVGLRDGARAARRPPPIALAVTVLTSEADTSAFAARLAAAHASGCDGVVCSGYEVALARESGLRTMVPGVRLAGGDVQDQARVVTPADAIAAGADWLVIGRAVTAAPDPVTAAIEVHAAVEAALAGRSPQD
jgi:orotidine-5'-phosphate decarboxylase